MDKFAFPLHIWKLKRFQLQGATAIDQMLDLPLDSAGGKTPKPHFWLWLRVRHEPLTITGEFTPLPFRRIICVKNTNQLGNSDFI